MPVSALFLLARSQSLQVLRHAEDFKRALAKPWLAKTPHFAVHHLSEGVVVKRRVSVEGGLSSEAHGELSQPVDKSLEKPVDNWVDKAGDGPVDAASAAGLATAWVGYVLPKRHARRAVTRNLLRRQMRDLLNLQHLSPAGLPSGLWVVRLRQGFDRQSFPSAASGPLRQAARQELQHLLAMAIKRIQGLRA